MDTCRSFRQLRRLHRLVLMLVALLTMPLATLAPAQEQRWTHYGVRPLAMGNAFVAVADDFNALFYNPAGIARLKGRHYALFNIGYEQSLGADHLFRDVQRLNRKSKSSVLESIDLIQQEAGNYHRFAASASPYWIERPFGTGIGYELGGSLTAHRTPAIRVDVGERAVLPVAFAASLLGDRISVGAAAKVRFQEGLNHVYTLEFFKELESDSNQDFAIQDYFVGGYGLGADFGLLFTPLDSSRATIGISITDLGATQYYPTIAAGHTLEPPTPVPPSVNVGFSVRPDWLFSRLPWLIAFDFHSVNQAGSFSRKFNIGSEVQLVNGVAVQAGFHQGYPSGGVQLRLRYFEARFVRYTEEIGAIAGDDPDDRYALQFKLVI